MRRRSLSASLLLLLVLVLASPAAVPHHAAAQDQTQYALDVRAGYGGAYRLGEWFPVVVNIGNDGADLRGMLEWSFPGQLGEQVFRQAIDLPRGSRKRVTLEVFARNFARNGQLRLLDGENALVSRDVSLESNDAGVFLIGIVSSDPALLNSLNSLPIAGFSSTVVRHVSAEDLPDQVAALRGLNMLFLHDIDTSALSPEQRTALALWVSLGGQLVVSGGVGGQRAAAGLADLLPAQVGGAIAQGDITPLAGFVGATAPPSAAATLSQAQPRARAEQLPPGSGLLFRWRYGAGLATFSAFDFASLRGWTGEGALWGKVLARQPIQAIGANARLSQTSLLERGVLKLPSLELPSTGSLLAFLLAYVLVIGPLNYIVLRRLRRLEWAWFTAPLIVLVFAGGLYVVGAGLRGGQSQLNQAAIVQGAEGQTRGFATAFIGLFSPRRATYTIGFAPDTLVGAASGRFSPSDQFEAIIADDTGARSIRVLADIVSVTTFVAEQAVDLPVSVQSSLASDRAGVRGDVRNTGSSALEDVLIVRGDSFARLGTLAPGASQSIAANSLQQNFPNAANLSDSGLFDRQEMLNALFDRDAARIRNPNLPSLGSSDDEGVYLLGWVNQPTIAASIEGRAATQNGLTLYVIRLQ
jgi:hypothetical protein